MHGFQVSPKRLIALTISFFIFLILLVNLYDGIPTDLYRNYDPAEGPAELVADRGPLNDTPQPGYFKDQPEWNWKVPLAAKGWEGYARKPRNRDIVVLTASDGNGHNSEIPRVLERVLEDRQNYCKKHGYTHLWLNTARYDIGPAHRTWSKIPGVAEAFYLNPNAEWVWMIDTDAIIMNPDISLEKDLLAPEAIEKSLMRDTPLLDGKTPTNVSTPAEYRVENIDILITQDHMGVNTGSVFFRRTAFTRYLLEMMTDKTLLMGQDRLGAEQDAIKHFLLEHELVRKHIGIFPQRKFNAFRQGGDNMGYRDGDLLVHLAGCWVSHKCAEAFEEFWEMKGRKEPWRPAKHD